MAGDRQIKCIIGLGNPGPKYAYTRHNAGYMVVDEIARLHGSVFRESGFSMLSSMQITSEGTDVCALLIKPLTYMNLSGVAVAQVVREHQLSPGELLVIHDDMDLPFGKIRFKRSGSSGGHRGIESIIAHLGSNEFARLKIGIGRPEPGVDPAEYVLQPFSETSAINRLLRLSAEAALYALRHGLDQAMNRYNGASLSEENVVE